MNVYVKSVDADSVKAMRKLEVCVAMMQRRPKHRN